MGVSQPQQDPRARRLLFRWCPRCDELLDSTTLEWLFGSMRRCRWCRYCDFTSQFPVWGKASYEELAEEGIVFRPWEPDPPQSLLWARRRGLTRL